jgi:hypothetical protein
MRSSKIHTIHTASVGSKASQILAEDQHASIWGNTSSGIFIKTTSNWLVFLSFEPYRGPLTLTLHEVDSTLRRVSPGAAAVIASNSVLLPESEACISFRGNEVWEPAPPSITFLDAYVRYQKLAVCAGEVLSQKSGLGLSPLLSILFEIPNDHAVPSQFGAIKWPDVLQLRDYIYHKEAAPLARLLSGFLGSGSGLTPSADDLIMGILLSLNRWQNPLWPADDLRVLNRQIVEAAYQKTTLISANLIECAALGLADERLIDALDFMMTGEACDRQVISRLLEWGNSSGVDVFAGMAVTLAGTTANME